MKGKSIQLGLAAVLGILVLVAFPAPSSVGAAEVIMALTAGAFFLQFLLIRRNFAGLTGSGKVVGWCLFAHVTGWMIASVIGVMNGVDTMGVIRSLLPQILFAPIAFLGLSLTEEGDAKKVARILVTVGVLHGLYLIGLGVFAYGGAGSASDLVLSRVTFLDPRTTMPLFLALAPFGLAALVEGNFRAKLWGLGGLLLTVSGALVTQTRAQILAVAVSIFIFGVVYVVSRPKLSVVVTALVVVGMGAVTVAAVPPLRNLAMAVFERQTQVGDNARLSEEWLPALNQWEMRGGESTVFGIGLGVPIKDFSGEEKTYIHNQTIYTLVYSGMVGFVLIGSLYCIAITVMIARYFRERNMVDLAAACCLISLVVYSQFFAVHKLFSFNLMVFLLIAIAMRANTRKDLKPMQDSVQEQRVLATS